MNALSEYQRMLRVVFRDERNGNDLTPEVILPAIPAVGEPVYIRERPHHRPQTGRVTARHWNIVTKEPENSEVIVLIKLD